MRIFCYHILISKFQKCKKNKQKNNALSHSVDAACHSHRYIGKCHGPLTRYVKLRIAHAPGMPATFSPPSTSKENDSKRSRHAFRHMRHARAVMHVGITNPRWRGKRSRHSRRMRNPQFYVSDKRPMGVWHTEKLTMGYLLLVTQVSYKCLYSLKIHRLIGIGIPIRNLMRSSDGLRFIMGFPILVRRRRFSE